MTWTVISCFLIAVILAVIPGRYVWRKYVREVRKLCGGPAEPVDRLPIGHSGLIGHGVGESAAIRDRQRSWDALGIAGRQVFHRYPLFVLCVVLSGSMAMRIGQREGE